MGGCSKEESSDSLNQQGRGSGEITASTTAASIATTATILAQSPMEQRDSVEEEDEHGIGYM